jgi:GH25 family lysozyme M1 (1,4-beta-N-acetylmuramidase)
MAELLGVDVSHHQQSTLVPWSRIRERSSFCICRSGYGAKLRDRNIGAHMRLAREHGFTVGLYHFFRPIHSPEAQFKLFQSVAEEVGCGPGDIVPFVDIEHDPVPKPGNDVQPSWSQPARDLVTMIIEAYSDCGVYISKREFGFLGEPSWLLGRPLWVAHYRDGAPETPASRPARIWQHRVGPYDPDGKGGRFPSATELVIDQNRAWEPLPLLKAKLPPIPKLEPGPQEFIGLPDDVYNDIAEQKRKDILDK